MRQFLCLILLFISSYGATAIIEQKNSLSSIIDQQVLETIYLTAEIPGWQSKEFDLLREGIASSWTTLLQEGVLTIQGKADKEVRPYFVALQGIIEHVLATQLQNHVFALTGMIHTPMPATPLCTKGEISQELVDPSIEIDPARLFTVKARTTVIRDYLFKGGDLYIIYPKEGLFQRTAEQQLIYQQELKNHPLHLFDRPLQCENIPIKLIGATYLFQDREGNRFLFAIQMTQAKDPQEIGDFGLWFGPLEHPAIQERWKAISTFLQQHSLSIL